MASRTFEVSPRFIELVVPVLADKGAIGEGEAAAVLDVLRTEGANRATRILGVVLSAKKKETISDVDEPSHSGTS